MGIHDDNPCTIWTKVKQYSFHSLVIGSIMGHVLPSLQSRPRLYNKSTIKTNGFKYRECVLVYVDDVLSKSDKPESTMAGISSK